MASRIPALPRDSHVQSHAAVHKNELCDSHAALVGRAIPDGWTRTRSGRWSMSALRQAHIIQDEKYDPKMLREGAPSQPLKTQKIGAIRLRRVMGERPASLSRYS
jgi:hypothetical protein